MNHEVSPVTCLQGLAPHSVTIFDPVHNVHNLCSCMFKTFASVQKAVTAGHFRKTLNHLHIQR